MQDAREERENRFGRCFEVMTRLSLLLLMLLLCLPLLPVCSEVHVVTAHIISFTPLRTHHTQTHTHTHTHPYVHTPHYKHTRTHTHTHTHTQQPLERPHLDLQAPQSTSVAFDIAESVNSKPSTKKDTIFERLARTEKQLKKLRIFYKR